MGVGWDILSHPTQNVRPGGLRFVFSPRRPLLGAGWHFEKAFRLRSVCPPRVFHPRCFGDGLVSLIPRPPHGWESRVRLCRAQGRFPGGGWAGCRSWQVGTRSRRAPRRNYEAGSPAQAETCRAGLPLSGLVGWGLVVWRFGWVRGFGVTRSEGRTPSTRRTGPDQS